MRSGTTIGAGEASSSERHGDVRDQGKDRRQALVGGAAYGFVVGFTFTAAGYGGADPLLSKVPFFAIFGLVSAAFGMALSLVGHWLTVRLRTASGGGSRQ